MKSLENMTDKELLFYREEVKKNIAKYNNLQLSKKVSL